MVDDIVLICGDRDWIDEEPIEKRLSQLPAGTVIIHGAARGADTIAGMVAERLGFKVVPYPAQWTLYGKGAGQAAGSRARHHRWKRSPEARTGRLLAPQVLLERRMKAMARAIAVATIRLVRAINARKAKEEKKGES